MGGRGAGGGGKGGGGGGGGIAVSAVRVDTDSFLASHGANPRGSGFWAFQIGGKTVTSQPMSFAKASLWAKKLAAKGGVSTIKVLP